jgi:hypothetical protein
MIRLDAAARELRQGEIDAGADRSAAGKRARRRNQLRRELGGGFAVPDDRPIHHHDLLVGTGPFDEAQRDGAMGPGLDGGQDARIRHRRGIAFALQTEFPGVDAARNVGRKHERDIDRFRPGGAGVEQDSAEERRHPSSAHRSHGYLRGFAMPQHRPIRRGKKDP